MQSYYRYFRRPRTTAERRMAYLTESDTYGYPVKCRLRKDLPTSWDDLYFSRSWDRSWKAKKGKKKRQWG